MSHTNSTLLNSARRARVYFALWPDRQVSQVLFALAGEMQKNFGGRVMRVETFHLTLLFLGEVPRQCLMELIDVADQVQGHSFLMRLNEFSCWKSNRIGYLAPSILPPALGTLSDTVRKRVATAGFGFDKKSFSPHVTLLRNISGHAAAISVAPIEWQVRDLVLVESVPEGAGRRYQVLKAWPLA